MARAVGTYMLACRSWPSSHASVKASSKKGAAERVRSAALSLLVLRVRRRALHVLYCCIRCITCSLVPVSPAHQEYKEEGAAFVVSRVKHTVVDEASNIAAE